MRVVDILLQRRVARIGTAVVSRDQFCPSALIIVDEEGWVMHDARVGRALGRALNEGGASA